MGKGQNSKKLKRSKKTRTGATGAAARRLVKLPRGGSSHSSALSTTYSAEQLFGFASELLMTNDLEDARVCCEAGLTLVSAGKEQADGLTLLATVELELGAVESAVAHLEAAVAADGAQASPHLYLAQLAEPRAALEHYTRGLALLEEDTSDEGRLSASRTLVAMTELYLTDLCFDDDAEARCVQYLEQAARYCEGDPEIYTSLASVRLSQQRPEEAREAADISHRLSRELDPNSPLYPSLSSRTNLAKIFLELGAHAETIDVLASCESEDDEELDVLYLLALAHQLHAEKTENAELLSDSLVYSDKYLKLVSRGEETDPEQEAHVNEIRRTISEKLGIALEDPTLSDVEEDEEGAENDEGEDPWEDIAD